MIPLVPAVTPSVLDPAARRSRLGVRALAGVAGVGLAAAAVHRDRIGAGEAAAFRLVNGLPDGLFPVLWPVMQLGALGAAPVAAGGAWLAGEPRLAARLLGAGGGSWLLAKVVKHAVRRPRPAALMSAARHRGREPSGLGFVSGHAAVATALGGALSAVVPAARPLLAVVVTVVGLSRVYVGAHLPLDVVGGVALGVAVEAGLGLIDRRRRGS